MALPFFVLDCRAPSTMGNTESVVVQRRLARFRPEERHVVEGVFNKLQADTGGPSGATENTPPGKALTLEMLQV